MPPRIQPHRVPTPSTCQCFRTRPECLPEAFAVPAQSRQFYKAGPPPNTKATRQRRDMWAWLHGPGKVFRDPLPGSTNYMSAYDNQGKLLRTKRQRQGQQRDQAATDIEVIPEEQEEEVQRREKLDGLDEKEIKANAQKRASARAAKADLDARGGVAKERPQDLRPYPLNPNFRSQSVLSEELREELYRQVVVAGIDVGTVSAAYGVDNRRVGAVVRLKTIEKRWEDENKPLAKPYHDAVLAMLPQTPFKPEGPGNRITPHEPINDLPVHPSTRQQLFYPVSESRQFTREDAAKAFHEDLLPADKRIPHPELIQLEKDHLAGLDREERYRRLRERDEKAQQAKEEAETVKNEFEARTQRIIETRRWEFKFQDISAEKVGKNGRSREGVGARYGMPHEDRKRGMVKIPTSVN